MGVIDQKNMNQMTLKIASLPIDHKTDIKGKPLESGKGSGDFFSIIHRLMSSVKKKSFHRHTEPPGPGLPLKKGYHFYLESLRKGLLAKGKPLDKISLNSKDLLVLKKFLYQCGFSQENVERLLKELTADNPRGEINLSRFFLKIAELGPPKRKIYQPITLEPSAIPHIESSLRDFGLTPKEIEPALSAARVENRELDLDRFVIELKGISNKRLPLEDMLKPDQFVSDVKATIDQILERVVVTQDRDRPIASLLSLSRLKLPPLKDKGSIDAKNGQKKVESSYPDRKTILLSDLDAGQARPPHLSPAGRDDGGRGLKKGPKAMHITQDITSSTSSETINTGKQNLMPVRDFLPDYLINQAGKQISMPILINPPELGVLKVEMDITGNILKLGMIAKNSSINELLPSNVHELREALVEQGVKLDRLDIQINYNSGQSLTNSKEWQGQELIGVPFIAEDDTEDLISGPRNMATGEHLLDLVA